MPDKVITFPPVKEFKDDAPCIWCVGTGKFSDHACRFCGGKGKGSVFANYTLPDFPDSHASP
jgi:DnaJ-class molecular chaperone